MTFPAHSWEIQPLGWTPLLEVRSDTLPSMSMRPRGVAPLAKLPTVQVPSSTLPLLQHKLVPGRERQATVDSMRNGHQAINRKARLPTQNQPIQSNEHIIAIYAARRLV